MPIYVDPVEPHQNCYVSLAEAESFLRRRPYTSTWDGATDLPDGYGFRVNDPGSALVAGATSIPVDGGTGTLANALITFQDPLGAHDIYTVTAATSSTLTISPGLVAVPADNAVVWRLTANQKEQALLWATSLLDDLIDWYGSQRYASRESESGIGPFQNLRWPRAGVVNAEGYTYPQESIPSPLKKATAEFAMYLLQRDLSSTPKLLGLGIESASLPGPLSVKINPRMRELIIPTYIVNMISELGELATGLGHGSRSVKLRRV